MRKPTQFIGYNEPVFDPSKRADVERYAGDPKRRGVWWEQSPYRYWWEFYRRANPNEIEPQVAQDFGELGSCFQTWWETSVNGEPRGFYLFAEHFGEPLVHVTQGNVADVLDNPNYVTVALNLRHNSFHLHDAVSKLVRSLRGRDQRESHAKYGVETIKNYAAIEDALKAWDVFQLEPDISKADLYVRVKGYSSGVRETDRTTGWRMLKRAQQYIAGVEKGEFPYDPSHNRSRGSG